MLFAIVHRNKTYFWKANTEPGRITSHWPEELHKIGSAERRCNLQFLTRRKNGKWHFSSNGSFAITKVKKGLILVRCFKHVACCDRVWMADKSNSDYMWRDCKQI